MWHLGLGQAKPDVPHPGLSGNVKSEPVMLVKTPRTDGDPPPRLQGPSIFKPPVMNYELWIMDYETVTHFISMG